MKTIIRSTLSLLLLLVSSMVSANEGVYEHTRDPQQLTLITRGTAALQLRLDMIARAKKSIELEYFIYNVDSAGRLLSQALLQKARAGVKVRILVDTSPSFALKKEYVMALRSAGIEVKYYNSSMILNLFKLQFRSHRKSLIVDSVEGITGGRNVADEYFDLSPEYNFMDTDIHVRGSIVKDMRRSFEEFWNSNLSEVPGDIRPPNPALYVETPGKYSGSGARYRSALNDYNRRIEASRSYITPNEADATLLKKVNKLGRELLSKSFSTTCEDTIFAADFPGIGRQTRVRAREILETVYATREEIFVESPYFVTREKSFPLMINLLNRGVSVNLLTNSLFSTDNYITQAAFDTSLPLWTQMGMNISVHNGTRRSPTYPVIDVASNARWGTHSKRAVIDGENVIIGTFNFDPRSANINAEMALICKNNPGLANAVKRDMQERMKWEGIPLDKLGFAKKGYNRSEAPLSKKIMFWLATPIANIFSFLI